MVTVETAPLVKYLKADLQRIVNSANEELKNIRCAGLIDSTRQAEEARVINEARAFAARRVESTVRHLHNMTSKSPTEHRPVNGVDETEKTARFKIAPPRPEPEPTTEIPVAEVPTPANPVASEVPHEQPEESFEPWEPSSCRSPLRRPTGGSRSWTLRRTRCPNPNSSPSRNRPPKYPLWRFRRRQPRRLRGVATDSPKSLSSRAESFELPEAGDRWEPVADVAAHALPNPSREPASEPEKL